VIPKAIAREMKLTEGTPLALRTEGGGIVLERQYRRPRRPLKQIVAQIKPASDYRERSATFLKRVPDDLVEQIVGNLLDLLDPVE